MWSNNIDFLTDQIVIFWYQQGSGGKFLINCLGLGSNAVFQDTQLATQQLNGKLGPAEKINELTTRLHQVKDKWNDLQLGCQQYFGVTPTYYANDYAELKSQWRFDPVVQRTINNGYYFFLICDNPIYFEKYQTVWPNAKVVVLNNPENFIKKYRPGWVNQVHPELYRYWNIIKDSNWPDNPPATIEELDQLPTKLQQELKENFSEIYMYLSSTEIDNKRKQIVSDHTTRLLQKTKHVFNWDLDWYDSADTVVEHVMSLAQNIGITGIDPVMVRVYYNEYTKTLERLRDDR